MSAGQEFWQGDCRIRDVPPTQGKLGAVKKLIGLFVLILGVSLSAHAQSRPVPAGGSSTGGGGNSLGSGGVGVGGSTGKVMWPNMLNVPRAQFSAINVSGTEQDFQPSTFLSFEKAVAIGQAVIDDEHASLAEVAARNLRAPKEKARIAFVEDAMGNAVVARR